MYGAYHNQIDWDTQLMANWKFANIATCYRCVIWPQMSQIVVFMVTENASDKVQ